MMQHDNYSDDGLEHFSKPLNRIMEHLARMREVSKARGLRRCIGTRDRPGLFPPGHEGGRFSKNTRQRDS